MGFFFTMLVEFPIESPLKPPCLAGCHGVTCKGVGKKWVRHTWQNPNKKEDSNLGTEATMISGWIACTFSTYTMCSLVHNNVINQHWKTHESFGDVTKIARQNLSPLLKVPFLVCCIYIKHKDSKGLRFFFGLPEACQDQEVLLLC